MPRSLPNHLLRWCACSRFLAQAIALALVLAAAPSCSRETDPRAVPDLLRPFDGSVPLTVDSRIVLPEQFDAFILGSKTLLTGAITALATTQGANHPADPFLQYLGVEGTSEGQPTALQLTLVSHAPLESAPTLVTVDPIQPYADGEFAFVIEIGHPISRQDLGDPSRLADLLKENARYVSRLGHLPGVRDAKKIGRLLTPRSRQGTLILGSVRLRRDEKSNEPAQVGIQVLNRRQKWLMDSEVIDAKQPAWRNVTLFKETRPGLLLGPGGTASFEVELPDAPTKLTAALAVAMARPDSAIQLEVGISSNGRTRTERIEILSKSTAWLPAVIDLAEFASERVRIELKSSAAAGTSDQTIAVFASALIATAKESARKDVILISLDTMRADHTSVFGYAKPTTPNLERLASSAAAFTRAQSTAPWTLPSHTSILSGLTVDRHGTHSFSGKVPADIPWLAREFARAGYETLAFTGGGFVSPEFGFAMGFDRYGEIDPRHPGLEWVDATSNTNERGLAQESDRIRAEITNLLSGPRHAPKFLFLHTYAAHDYRTQPALLERLGIPKADIPALLAAMTSTTAQGLVDKNSDPSTLDARLEAVTRIYDGSIALADLLVGTVLDALEASGRLDDTIVIVTSDHGEELLDHGAVGHGSTLYQEQIHIPLLIHAPGHPAGRYDDVVSNIDIAPTLRQLVGLPALAECDGRSLVPRLNGETLEPVPAFARGSHRDRVYRAMQGTQYKVITEIDSTLQSKRQLFDTVADPREQVDLALKRQELAEQLANRLADRVADAQAQAKKSQSTEIGTELDQRLNELGYTGRDGD